jgi:hypothetical protein
MRRLALIALVGLGVLGLAGCVTPSIPIPPPDPSKMTFTLSGDPGAQTTSLVYPANATYVGGVAYVYNQAKGVGVIQAVNANGSIGPTPPVAAMLGDQIVVSVENDEQTVSQCIVLREGVQDPTSYCQ